MLKFKRLVNTQKSKFLFLFIWSALLSQEATHAKFDGFYVGGSLGYLQQNTSIDAAQNPSNPNAHINRTQAQQGHPTTELFVGWGKKFAECFYGGLEGRIDWVVGKNKKIAEDIVFKYSSGRKGPGISVLGRFGLLTSPHTMLYGGVGFKVVTLEQNIFEKEEEISAPYSRRTIQPLFEGGIETLACEYKKLVMRLSYTYMPQRPMNQKSTLFPQSHMYRNKGFLKTETAEHALKMGIAYRF